MRRVSRLLGWLKRYGGVTVYLPPATRLLHCNGTNGATTLVDSSAANATVSVFASAQLSTAQVKYGSASLDLTGAGNPYVSLPIPSINVRTASFTFQGWFRPTANGDNVFFTLLDSSDRLYLQQIAGTLYLGDGFTNPIASTFTFTAAAWVHVAVTFDGATYSVWIDGALFASTTTLLTAATPTTLQVGGRNLTAKYFAGYVDECAWYDGVCAYVAPFVPPLSEVI